MTEKKVWYANKMILVFPAKYVKLQVNIPRFFLIRIILFKLCEKIIVKFKLIVFKINKDKY